MKCPKCNFRVPNWDDHPRLMVWPDEKKKCPVCDRIFTETIGGELIECIDTIDRDKDPDYMEWQQ